MFTYIYIYVHIRTDTHTYMRKHTSVYVLKLMCWSLYVHENIRIHMRLLTEDPSSNSPTCARFWVLSRLRIRKYLLNPISETL